MNKSGQTPAMPTSIRFFLYLLAVCVIIFAVSFYTLNTIGISSSSPVRTLFTDVGLFLIGLLTTSGLVALWDWLSYNQHNQLNFGKDLGPLAPVHSENPEENKIRHLQEEILALQAEKSARARLKELERQRDQLHKEVHPGR